METSLDVCICTHNPKADVFAKVLQALANQTLSTTAYQLLIVDNQSNPPIDTYDLTCLQKRGVRYTILREEELGVLYARQCAIEATNQDLLVFVDDDNELYEDYLENVLRIANNNPSIGCFGGRRYPPPKVTIPSWAEPFLPFLAVDDRGEEVITKYADYWGLWEPPTAGAAVRRPVLEQYVKHLRTDHNSRRMGRKGSQGLMSGEDSLLARGAYRVGLECSYQPSLKLTHHIDVKRRLKYFYLIRLFLNYGRTYIVLDRVWGLTIDPVGWKEALRQIVDNYRHRESKSWIFDLCMVMWDIGRLGEQGIIWDWDIIKPWNWGIVLPKISFLNRASKERVPLSEKSPLLGYFKQTFNSPWEIARKIALKLKIIS